MTKHRMDVTTFVGQLLNQEDVMHSEPPWVFRRPQTLTGWSHVEHEKVPSRSARTNCKAVL